MTAATHRHSESVTYIAMSHLYVPLTVQTTLLQNIATGHEIAHPCAYPFAEQFTYPRPYPFTQDSHGYPCAWSTGHAPTATATAGSPGPTETSSPPLHCASPRYCAAPLHETPQEQPNTLEFAVHSERQAAQEPFLDSSNVGKLRQYSDAQVHSLYAQTAYLSCTPQAIPKVEVHDNGIIPSPASYCEYNHDECCSTRRNLFSSLPHQSFGKLRVDFAEELGDDVQEHYSTDTLPENMVKTICFEYATARNELLRVEMYSRVTIDKLKTRSDKCAN